MFNSSPIGWNPRYTSGNSIPQSPTIPSPAPPFQKPADGPDLYLLICQFFLFIKSPTLLFTQFIYICIYTRISILRLSHLAWQLSCKRQQLFTPVFRWRSVLLMLKFLCCPIMCLYVLSSLLWCPLRFPHKNYVRFVFSSSLCLFAYIMLSNTYCVVIFSLFFFVFCTICSCCQFVWIVHFWLPLWYSLTFSWQWRSWDLIVCTP